MANITKNHLIKTVILTGSSIVLYPICYILLYHLHYYPGGLFESLPYFYPRFYKNEFSEPFSDWKTLLIVLLINYIIIKTLFQASLKIKNDFFYKLLLIVFVNLVSYSFLYLSPNKFAHLKIQVDHVYNGLFYGIKYQLMEIPDFKNARFINKVLYPFFGGHFNNNCGYSFIGTTHPPGQMSIGVILFEMANALAKYAVVNVAYVWGILVTFLNSLIILFVYIILKNFNQRCIVRQYMPILLASTAVALHFCVLSSGLSLLCMVISIYFIIQLIYNVSSCNYISIIYSCLSGLFLTLQAQFSYGDGIPVFAISVALFLALKRKNISKTHFFQLVFAFLLFPLFYFIFEYVSTGGESNWIIRGLKLATFVSTELQESRPFFVSQISNFSIIFWEAGLLAISTIFMLLSSLINRHAKFKNQTKRGIINSNVLWFFIGNVACLMLFGMLIQQSNRLEVHRTWQWFLGPLWIYGFIIFRCFIIIFKRNRFMTLNTALNVLYCSQLGLTFLYALIFQDQQ